MKAITLIAVILLSGCSAWEGAVMPIYADAGEKLGAHLKTEVKEPVGRPLASAAENLAEALEAAFAGKEKPWYANRVLALLKAIPVGFDGESE